MRVTLNDVLIAAGAAAGYVLLLLVSPTRRCSWCKGSKRAKRHRWWGRNVMCRKCKGHERHYRLGGPIVHRLRQAVLADLRQRKEQQ